METFSATQAFVRVLFPAFGRPTMATNPHLNGSASGIGEFQISNFKFQISNFRWPVTQSLDSELLSQSHLQGIHLAPIGLMIVTKKMQKPMKHQLLNLRRQRMAFLPRIAPRRFHRNNDIAKKT